ncbi:MAG: hypothetical protein PHR56_06975 [Dehalococcoidales bacterium]|nr:hypothetical protein [Dehalococcoidales bacterium]
MSLWHRARQVWREEGLGRFCKRLLLFLRQFLYVYSSYDIYESNLTPPETRCDVDLIIKKITSPEDLAEIESRQTIDEGFDMPRNRELLGMNAILYGALVNGGLAHMTQALASSPSRESYPFAFAMPDKHTAGLAGYTSPEYRRKNIHACVRAHTLRELKQQGFLRAWDVQNPGNIAARDAVLKLGYYFWGKGSRLRLFNLLTIERVKPVSRFTPRGMRWSYGRHKSTIKEEKW